MRTKDSTYIGDNSGMLTPSRRKELIRALRAKTVAQQPTSVPIPVTNLQLLRELGGGEIFDHIAITMQDNKDDHRVDVVIEMEKKGNKLPRVLNCFLTAAGKPITLTEFRVRKRSPRVKSNIGNAGDAVIYEYGGEGESASLVEGASDHEAEAAKTALSQFDRLLQLAAVSLDHKLSLN